MSTEFGINIPWFDGDYGHDLGNNIAHPNYPVNFNEIRIEFVLQSLVKYKISLLRIWLFENREGLIYDHRGEIIGIDPIFLKNLERLVQLLRQYHIKVYWTLLDANSIIQDNDSITRSILINPVVTDQFIRYCILPCIEVIQSVTWGIDLCNEPESIIFNARLNKQQWEKDWSQVISGLLSLLDGIKERWPYINIGIGSGYDEGTSWNELYRSRIGWKLDIVDIHSHCIGKQVSLEDPRFGSWQLLVIGELGHGAIDHDASHDSWLDKQKDMEWKIRTIPSQKYKAVFLWYFTSMELMSATNLYFGNEPSKIFSVIQQINDQKNSHDWFTGLNAEIPKQKMKTYSQIILPLHLRQMGSSDACGHRSGWRYVLDMLSSVPCSSNLILDDFIERTFQREDNNQVWKVPWVGIMHHPPQFPLWLDETASLETIMETERFKISLPYLKAIIVLSEHLKQWLKSKVDVPIFVLKHPTEIPKLQFSYKSFLMSKIKSVIQVGYFSKNIRAIDQVRLPKSYKKIHVFNNKPWIINARDRVDRFSPWRSRKIWGETEIVERLSDDSYDSLLGKSLVLCEFFDASASNVIIESIARNTPIIVNRHPAVIEYLGSTYPLLFNDINDIYDMVSDADRIKAAHDYLYSMDKSFLSGDIFAKRVSSILETIGRNL